MFWTVAETAAYLTLTEKLVYKLSKNGTLPSFRFGGCVRFDPEQVKEWAKSCQVKPLEIPSFKVGRHSGKNSEDLLDRVIGKAKRAVYTGSCGKPGPRKGGN